MLFQWRGGVASQNIESGQSVNSTWLQLRKLALGRVRYSSSVGKHRILTCCKYLD